MPAYAYDVEAEQTAYPRAPSREDFAKVSDRSAVVEMQYDAEDIEIAIKTQLEFWVGEDPRLRGRRIAALIFWRRAVANAKRRLVEMSRESNRAAAVNSNG